MKPEKIDPSGGHQGLYPASTESHQCPIDFVTTGFFWRNVSVNHFYL